MRKKWTCRRFNSEGWKDPPVSSCLISFPTSGKKLHPTAPLPDTEYALEQKGVILKVHIIQFSTGLVLTIPSSGSIITDKGQDCTAN